MGTLIGVFDIFYLYNRLDWAVGMGRTNVFSVLERAITTAGTTLIGNDDGKYEIFLYAQVSYAVGL